MPEIKWLLEETVLAIHKRQIAEHGGSDGVRDLGLLLSALARPQNLLAYSEDAPDISALAAAYAGRGANRYRNYGKRGRG